MAGSSCVPAAARSAAKATSGDWRTLLYILTLAHARAPCGDDDKGNQPDRDTDEQQTAEHVEPRSCGSHR